MFYFGLFSGVWSLIANVSEHSVAYEDGTDSMFRNVGYLTSQAGEQPKRKHTTTVKFTLEQAIKGPEAEQRYTSTVSLNSAIGGGGGG
jgi:hypothetical protein